VFRNGVFHVLDSQENLKILAIAVCVCFLYLDQEAKRRRTKSGCGTHSPYGRVHCTRAGTVALWPDLAFRSVSLLPPRRSGLRNLAPRLG
jgi:hypothetical protein